jgi:signal transduction histidine kinase
MTRLGSIRLARPGMGEPVSDDDHVYKRWYERFVVIFGLIAVVAIIFSLLDGDEPISRRLIGTAAALGAIGWFAWRGRWELLTSDLRVALYLVGQLLLVVLAIRMWDGFGLLLFGAYWMGFAYLRILPALVYALVLTLGSQWAFGAFDSLSWSPSSISPTVVVISALALVVSGMMASYIESFAREADRRAQLLDELRRTQDELARREREAGVQDERQRLAGEIHDTIAQQFTSIVTNLEAAEARAQTNPGAAQHHVLAAREAARQGIADARALVHALQPGILEGRSLGEALNHIASSSALEDQTSIRFQEEGDSIRLDRVRETVIVRALQESLQNIRKHAGARNVVATLSWLEDEIILDVQDDGAGFDPEAVRPSATGHRMGLVTMKQRVENAGGTFMIDASPGEGTSLAISFPIQRGDEAHHVTG